MPGKPSQFLMILSKIHQKFGLGKGGQFSDECCVSTLNFLMTGTRIHQKIGPGKGGQFLMNLVFQLSKNFRRPAVQFTAITC